MKWLFDTLRKFLRGFWKLPPSPVFGLALAARLIGTAPLNGAETVVSTTNLTQEVTALFINRGHIEAVTRRGFYEAERTVRTWHVMEVPASMPPGGRFATGPEPSGEVYYYTALDRSPGASVSEAWIHGLYRRATAKGPWELMSGPEDFHHVLVHSNAVFAIAGDSLQTPSSQKVLRSTDHGRTWEKLSGNQAAFRGLRSIFPDPDHPGQVCLRADGLRGMIWQAPDAGYQWEEERELRWRRGRPVELNESESGFFMPRFGSSTYYPIFQLTLANFFAFPEEDLQPLPVPPVNYPGLALSVGGGRTFFAGSPIMLPVELKLRVDARVGNLVDWPDETACWGLRRVTPDGKAEAIGPRAPSGGVPGTPPTLHPLTPNSPYRRNVYLNALADFREPGRYRVQLIYSSSNHARKDRRQWPVEISGPVIDLLLKR